MGTVGFWNTVKRGIRQLACRRIYVVAMVIVPVGSALFFLDLLDEGLPLGVPVAVVDLDDSPMSRDVIRSLDAMDVVDIGVEAASYTEAYDLTRRGEIFGFFMIPDDFGKEAVSGRKPTISYYCNMAGYIPGTLSFKGFKTVAVSTSGKMVETVLVSTGMDESGADAVLQPVVIQEHLIGNPWSNYAIYLGNSFIPGVVALMTMLVAAYSIGDEIKCGSSRQWLETARGSIAVAVAGKLFPQAVVFSVIGIFCQSLLYGYMHFPLNGSPLLVVTAMVLLVVASQAFALIFCCIIPNLRLSLSIVSLLGILSFSITGFSFPVQNMYGAVGIFSYIIPLRYYFLIYVDQALNGIPLYYSRWYFAALLTFPVVAMSLLWNLKRACIRSVYVP
ncbi:MAG: ABC transporter permease [Muribaculaceae bacterium]|nr:ABC transporter permease [Muribaculaceae bacterium]